MCGCVWLKRGRGARQVNELMIRIDIASALGFPQTISTNLSGQSVPSLNSLCHLQPYTPPLHSFFLRLHLSPWKPPLHLSCCAGLASLTFSSPCLQTHTRLFCSILIISVPSFISLLSLIPFLSLPFLHLLFLSIFSHYPQFQPPSNVQSITGDHHELMFSIHLDVQDPERKHCEISAAGNTEQRHIPVYVYVYVLLFMTFTKTVLSGQCTIYK